MSEKRVAWERPVLHPLPKSVQGIQLCVMNLNGTDWRINRNPVSEACQEDGWKQITVPCQVSEMDHEYAFEKWLDIPTDWNGKRIFLRFDGVNCMANVFIDGQFVKSHYGGFVSWDCEITDFVQPEMLETSYSADNNYNDSCSNRSDVHNVHNLHDACNTHRLIIRVEDRPQELSPFHTGGIIRDVQLYALPAICLSRLQVETTFDTAYENAHLTVETCIEEKKTANEKNAKKTWKDEVKQVGDGTEAEYLLTDPDGTCCSLGIAAIDNFENQKTTFAISKPKKWDSEHPWLYTLTVVLRAQGIEQERVNKRFGFRQIEKRDNQVFVNGNEIKLRGINRHEIYPTTKRSLTRELVEEDVRLFKEANINFIRTSHYPPRPEFLDLCDQYGIYVEDEIAIAFLGYGTNLTQDDPAYRDFYLGQFSELIERDRSHPSVLIWSPGNESYWGENIGQCLAWARQEDPNRLTVFSYPLTQKEDDEITDLWSVHYASWDSNLADKTECFRRSFYDGPDMPVIHDESTHIPCYDIRALKRDPGIRDFWGETIKLFWERIWETKGALGCAVWAGIDDVTVEDGTLRGAHWGILDGWRRKKPEYWHIKKAYSPVVIKDKPIFLEEKTLIHLYNRFNHTNLNELVVEWKCGEKTGQLAGPEAMPGTEGILTISTGCADGKKLEIRLIDSFGFVVDEHVLSLSQKNARPHLCGKAPNIFNGTMETKEANPAQKQERIVQGTNFKLIFSETTGLLTAGYYQDELVLTGGPYLHLTGLDLEPWKLDKMECQEMDDCARISLSGSYGCVKVLFLICIDAEGMMEVNWKLQDMPYPSPRKIAVTGSITSHAGGYDEAGIGFTVANGLDQLSWKRKGIWDSYPDWHIGRLEGEADKHCVSGVSEAEIAKKIQSWAGESKAVYQPETSQIEFQRQSIKPDRAWKDEEVDTVLFGRYDIGHRGTRDFSSLKAYVERASLKNEKAAFTVLSDGCDSVRMEVSMKADHLISDRDKAVIYHGNWLPRENRYHSFSDTESWSKNAGDWCEYAFEGTGIVWYSSLDRICGTANVYIDDVLQAEELDLSTSRMGKSPRGYSKGWHYPAFAIQNLPDGTHKIRIEVTGKPARGSHSTYVNIDSFLILDGNEEGDTRFLIDREFNYPEISWADYCKPPVRVETGYSGTVYVKLEGRTF